MKPLAIRDVPTPARLYAVSATESEFGGRTVSLSLIGTVWGQFRPEPPRVVMLAQGDGAAQAVVQDAEFLCRAQAGVVAGSRLRIDGHDWRVINLFDDEGGNVRVRMERVHG